MTFQIKSGSGELYQPAGEELGGVSLMQQSATVRELRMAPGTVFDDGAGQLYREPGHRPLRSCRGTNTRIA